MRKLIKYLKIWNMWRKRNLNSKFYKILVLFKIVHSPTYEFQRSEIEYFS